MLFLKQSTAVTETIGPFVDSTDGNTEETGLTIAQADVRLSKNGGAWAQKNNATSCTHQEKGWYSCPLNETDTGTLGVLKLHVHVTGALPVWVEYMVVPTNVWDSLFSTDRLQVDCRELGDAALDLTTTMKASVNAEVDTALDTAIPGSPTADSINQRVKALDDKLTPKTYLAGTNDPGGDMPAASLGAQAKQDVNAEMDTALADVDLDHLIQVTAGAEKATIGSYLDKIMNKDGSQTFDPVTDSLEMVSEEAFYIADTVAALSDGVKLSAQGKLDVNAEMDTALADVDLDHLAKTSYGATKPADGSLLDQIMNKDGSQTFDPTTDSLERISNVVFGNSDYLADLHDNGVDLSTQAKADLGDAAWDELLIGHGAVGSAGKALAEAGEVQAGAYEHTVTVKDYEENPVPQATIWITADVDGSTVVRSGVTNDNGEFIFHGDNGVSYYIWCRKAGMNFTNPTLFGT